VRGTTKYHNTLKLLFNIDKQDKKMYQKFKIARKMKEKIQHSPKAWIAWL